MFSNLSYTDNVGYQSDIRSHIQQINSRSPESEAVSNLTGSFSEPIVDKALENTINNNVFRLFSNINREKIKILLPEVEHTSTNFGQTDVDLVVVSETGKWMHFELKKLKEVYREQESLFEDYELKLNKKETKQLIKRLKKGLNNETKQFIEKSITFYKEMKKKEELYKQGKL